MNRLTGLIAATYTPFHADGPLNTEPIPAYVDFLLKNGVSGLYVCGSTGEGVSMTTAERRTLAEAFVQAAAGRVPVIVQVGHNSLQEARDLAAHAADAGADVISAVCPFYFKPASIDLLVRSMAEVAAGAPGLPFYYYHIPSMTGVSLSMTEFLTAAADSIPNLAGLKFTSAAVYEYQSCLAADDGCFDILWGYDEMLLSALVVGAKGAVGSTYNIAAPLYRKLIDAFAAGDLTAAKEAQAKSVAFIQLMARYPFHSATKRILREFGFDMGTCRLPQASLSPEHEDALLRGLNQIGFFDACACEPNSQRVNA